MTVACLANNPCELRYTATALLIVIIRFNNDLRPLLSLNASFAKMILHPAPSLGARALTGRRIVPGVFEIAPNVATRPCLSRPLRPGPRRGAPLRRAPRAAGATGAKSGQAPAQAAPQQAALPESFDLGVSVAMAAAAFEAYLVPSGGAFSEVSVNGTHCTYTNRSALPP
jgi:hypothetical protein